MQHPKRRPGGAPSNPSCPNGGPAPWRPATTVQIAELEARVALVEQIAAERWGRLDRTLTRLEAAIDRLDRRMWLAAVGCAAAGASLALGAGAMPVADPFGF